MALSTIFQIYRGGQFLFLEETGVAGENHRLAASHWQTVYFYISVRHIVYELKRNYLKANKKKLLELWS